MTQFWDIPNNLDLQEWESLRATIDWFETFTPADESDIPDISWKANLSWWNTFSWNQTIEWWLTLNTTTGAIVVPRMTTTERNAITEVNGMLIFNTTTNQFNFFDTQWKWVVMTQGNQSVDWNKTFLQNIRITKWDTETKWYEWSDWSTIYWFYRNWNEHLNLSLWVSVNHWFRTNWQVWIWGFPSDRLTVFWNIIPWTDNANSLGTTSNRFSSIWSTNWTIQTSDERQKTEIKQSELWLDFINRLNPVSFKWIVWWNEVAYEDEEFDEEYEDEDGNKQTRKAIRKKEVITPREWKREHYWLIAQELEWALQWKDFWWLIIDENWNYWVRYDQLISPLIKAFQEYQTKTNLEIQELTNRVNELENKNKIDDWDNK